MAHTFYNLLARYARYTLFILDTTWLFKIVTQISIFLMDWIVNEVG